ncbi:MAG: hypothetical protein AMXMBFR8_02170 [Nevskiales bacterium]
MNENAQLFLSRVYEAIAAADRGPIRPTEIADRTLAHIPEDRRLPLAQCRRLADMALMLRFSPLDVFDPDRGLVEVLDPDLSMALAGWFDYQIEAVTEYAVRRSAEQAPVWLPPDLPPAA